jgi:flavin reductase (DIM6/NTAB) family NADH-FMN oxidoreductase RutF
MTNPFSVFDQQWMLLTSGDFEQRLFNTMTISWGFMGTIWGKPVVQVAVRPSRFTFEFMEKYDTFTVCALPRRHRQTLQILGTVSGRDGDKIAESGLTPVAVPDVAAPSFDEAELIIACRKIYWQDTQPVNFFDLEIARTYEQEDRHAFTSEKCSP